MYVCMYKYPTSKKRNIKNLVRLVIINLWYDFVKCAENILKVFEWDLTPHFNQLITILVLNLHSWQLLVIITRVQSSVHFEWKIIEFKIKLEWKCTFLKNKELSARWVGAGSWRD